MLKFNINRRNNSVLHSISKLLTNYDESCHKIRQKALLMNMKKEKKRNIEYK